MRVELTESGFADRTATATYGTFIAAETGIEPISSESESSAISLTRYASLATQVLVLLRRTHPHFVRTLDYFVIESKSDTFTLFGYKQMLMDLNHY